MPPEWFTNRYGPCNPFKLGKKLLFKGTKPYFDELFYNNPYAPSPKYDYKSHGLWKPVPLQQLVDTLFAYGAYNILKYLKRLERCIRQATSADYCTLTSMIAWMRIGPSFSPRFGITCCDSRTLKTTTRQMNYITIVPKRKLMKKPKAYDRCRT